MRDRRQDGGRMGQARPARTRVAVGLHSLGGALAVGFALWVLAWPAAGPAVGWRALLSAAYVASMVSAVARCRRSGWRREDVAMLVGILSSGAGSVYWAVVLLGLDPVPSLSWADPLWTAVFPAVVLSLTMEMARGRLPQRDFAVDALIGSAGAAAAVLAFVAPLLGVPELGAARPAVQAAAIYVAGDVVLVLLVVTAISTFGGRHAPHLWSRLGGLALFALVDALTLVSGGEQGVMDGLSLRSVGLLLGFMLLETSVGWRLPVASRPIRRGSTLVMPIMGVVLSLAVLVSGWGDTTARGLAAVAIAIATVRMAWSFRAVAALADTRRLAHTDDLTDLPNRRGFARAARERLSEARPTTIVLFDLDGFQDVNEALGHGAGDELLLQVAGRLRDVVRPDGADVVARFGGDEFAAMVGARPGHAGDEDAEALVAAVGGEYTIDSIAVQVSAAAGVVHAPQDGSDLDELLRRADVAMVAAKERRLSTLAYTEELDTRSRDWLRRVEQVRAALSGGCVEVHYQPKVELATGEVVGVEALARLRIDRELWMPGRFLEIVTKAGLLPALTDQVLATALRDARRWEDAGFPLSVAVNVCAAGVTTGRLPRVIRTALDREGLRGSSLVVEVTEHDLLIDHASGRAALDEVRALGSQVSIDDYGTGYSSLAYLRDLPVDEIKLDRTFVAAMSGDLRGTEVVESTVRLAHRLGHRVVAEGVETGEDLAAVRDAGCDLVQGYLLARPMPAGELERWRDSWHAGSLDTLAQPAALAEAVPAPRAPAARPAPQAVAAEASVAGRDLT
ncbi:bifunctional diguanylate cyclase/phosphodiesterase [Isoptericola sp. b490]|uniref:putative bifunctional diguanylate cyclase/phosphodiesterase n=1 Tax=Actinotalea lenta TaxID=3064654 RepID=UPI0027138BB6|nr:bifunctional diguanylate cyclase/phosphodiesterase [Isoptericola sp. b490]MDO8120280.1 bifunctional diguanylate cyclase/phosphodiesterase [Isoptericola sp. b490]